MQQVRVLRQPNSHYIADINIQIEKLFTFS